MSTFDYSRRHSSEAAIGNVVIGYGHPIAVQSMTNTPTLDTDASVAQIERIAEAGADIVRLTAQSVNHARNLANIKAEAVRRGCDVPLVADIHFTPDAAMVAAEVVEKVRINPGNFVDPARTFRHLEYTDAEYADELARIENRLTPLLDLCKSRGVALRIGVNHGSLSDRIMSRYGNTPAGMVESAMEFLRIARAHDFNNVVISIKASNVTVMVETVRLLASAMKAEGMAYPLHLGVTEAGDGEDGRIKSAVGIGSLLAEGIGDTIRVSLSEAPEAEPPVARKLVEYVGRMAEADPIEGEMAPGYNPVAPERRKVECDILPCPYPVIGLDIQSGELHDGVAVISSDSKNYPGHAKAQMHRMLAEGDSRPAILKVSYPASMAFDDVVLAASVDLGAVLLSGFGDGLWIDAPHLPQDKLNSLALGILQAARLRISKTEYIACPSCGRTLFDLPAALAQVRAATAHLPGLKIAMMGCIVNGPGEMADADYGYVGAGVGNVSLYKGKQLVHKNLPADQALPLLIQLIKDNGDWKDAPSQD
ncbi:MAG: (E)-4-hydroxy-3-methylbut-2-enyl-diphosphate synthase [Muribaculaceae bacterium]|nr:(E)-4-hydroxy-3-methylbut-2-enyl-diphosphate synthase [Muribaculaceae bacterium]